MHDGKTRFNNSAGVEDVVQVSGQRGARYLVAIGQVQRQGGKTLIVLFCSERGTERAFHGIVGRFGQSHIVLRGQSWPVVPRDIGELMTEMEWPNFVPKLLQ